MTWVAAVLWAVLTGMAAGINPDWQSVIARQCSGTPKDKPKAEKEAPAGSRASNTTPADNGPQVHVEVPKREGEFASGVPFAGGARPSRPDQAVDSAGRRKRRSKPAPTPAEHLCARCKAAIEHELQPVDVADLARAQEAETDDATLELQPLKDASEAEASEAAASEAAASESTERREPACERKASTAENPPRPRGPIGGRLATSLGLRGALARLVGKSTTEQTSGG